MFKLRDYQQRLADDAIAAMSAGNKPVIVAPTGAGKSAILAELVRKLVASNQPAIVSCHRREILLHLERSIAKHCGINPAVISADNKIKLNTIDNPVKLVMVPTLSRRKGQIPESWIGSHALLADECHHAPSPTHFGLIELLKPLQLAGTTATPVSCRSDRSLGDVFDTLLLGPEPEELVAAGFLSPVVVYACDESHALDTTGARTRGGDYVMADLEAAARKIAGSTVEVWKQYNQSQAQTLVACCTLAHAADVTKAFEAADIKAAMLDGSMATAKRDQIISDFSSGAITVLCFVSLIDEGLDIPEAECLVFARPTKSLRLRRQLEGRVRRIHPGKVSALIIDQTDSWKSLPLPNDAVVWSLQAAGETGAKVERTPRQKVERTEAGTVQIVELSHAEFRQIQLRSRTWREPPELITALRNGPSALRRLAARLRFGNDRARMGALKALAAWPASQEDLETIGRALGFRDSWAADSYSRNVAKQSMRNPVEHAAAKHLLSSTIDAAILAGELRPGAGRHLHLVGARIEPPQADQEPVSWMVAAVSPTVATRLDSKQKQRSTERITAALAPRLERRGYRLEILGLELTMTEQALALFDAAG